MCKLIAYAKEKNGKYYIYEKGKTYVGMIEKNVNRMFKALDFKPLTFDDPESANDWCNARNEIMDVDFV